MKNMIYKVAAMSALCLVAGGAFAQTYTFKLGGARIDPRATSSDLSGVLPAWAGNAAVPAGVQLEVQPKATLIFSVSRAFTSNLEAELVLGIPPKHDVKARASDSLKAQSGGNPIAAYISAFDGKTVATVTSIAPTVFINYKFGEASSSWRPYVGVGLNYTHSIAKATSVGESFYQDGPVKIELTDSFGLAFQAGVSYKIDKTWSLNAGWTTAAVKNSLNITTATSHQSGEYRFHPSVFSLTVGYQY